MEKKMETTIVYWGYIWVVVKIMALFGSLLNYGAPNIQGTQKGVVMLTTTHMLFTCTRAASMGPGGFL